MQNGTTTKEVGPSASGCQGSFIDYICFLAKMKSNTEWRRAEERTAEGSETILPDGGYRCKRACSHSLIMVALRESMGTAVPSAAMVFRNQSLRGWNLSVVEKWYFFVDRYEIGSL
jgi:hypothetical protein